MQTNKIRYLGQISSFLTRDRDPKITKYDKNNKLVENIKIICYYYNVIKWLFSYLDLLYVAARLQS